MPAISMPCSARMLAAAAAFTLLTLSPGALHAQATGDAVFKTLYSFGISPGDSGYPEGGLIAGPDGNFYGTTGGGGANNLGTVYKITPSGMETTLHSFSGATDGSYPQNSLTLGPDGNFYGTTLEGGGIGPYSGSGSAFRITPSGNLTTLHAFSGPDGQSPMDALLVGADGSLYGTTVGGGPGTYNGNSFLYGGVTFKLTQSGVFTPLHYFYGNDGGSIFGGVVLGPDGNFYGTTEYDGENVTGTIFEVTPDGQFGLLHTFTSDRKGYNSDGAAPFQPLVVAPDGTMYGTTSAGGPHNNGTIFKITPSGKLTTVYSPEDSSGAVDSYAPMIFGTDGNLYGVSTFGGANGTGTVFQITPSGILTTLYTFGSVSGSSNPKYANADGAYPEGTLLQIGDVLYGTCANGGVNGSGTVFTLTVPELAPPFLALNFNSVTGGVANVTGTITLPDSAPTGGAAVTLTSSNRDAAIVPPTVTVPAGASTATFTATTQALPSALSTTISASYNGASASSSLVVTPPALSIVTLPGGGYVKGGSPLSDNRVYLTGNAFSDTLVSITSSNPSVATVPSAEIILTGTNSHSFIIQTNKVKDPQRVTIRVTSGGVSKSTLLTVVPRVPALESLTLAAATVEGGTPLGGNRVLLSRTSFYGTPVTLASSNPAVAAVPSTEIVLPTKAAQSFFIQTSNVAAATTVTITAVAGPVTKTQTLTVTP